MDFSVVIFRDDIDKNVHMVLLNDACRFGGVDELTLNSVDMMKFFNNSRFGGIPIVEKYEFNGKVMDTPPLGTYDLQKVRPIYTVLDGFNEDITKMKNFDELPANARKYVFHVKNKLKEIGVSLNKIGVGPRRDQLIRVPYNI
jgi:adenylosuccinate synthase